MTVHTDTSRSGDLVELLRRKCVEVMCVERDAHCAEAADRIEALEAEVERLRERLEIDPSHPYDGIYARDETIRGLDAKVERLEERLGEAYQIAGHIAVEYDGNGRIERLLDLLAGINLGEEQ